MAGRTDFWGKVAGAAVGVVGALAAVGLGFTLSQAWQAQIPPERVEIALPRQGPVLPAMLPASPPAVAKPSPPVPAPKALPSPAKPSVAATRPAAALPARRGTPLVALVIDDLGADIPNTRRAIALPKQVTLSFLPYPGKTPELSHDGFCAGHEVILHMPMEPKGNANPGPNALLLELPKEEIVRRVLWALSRVPDADGMNNHEGSWFTSDHKALIPVMQVLKKKHLFFLDSRTSIYSMGAKLARAASVPTASRDVFIDDVIESGAIARQLGLIESRARRKGLVIAIGHPHHQTLAALEAWIPAVEKLGYVLVPLSEAIKRRNAPGDSASLSAPAR